MNLMGGVLSSRPLTILHQHSEVATVCRFNAKGDLVYVGTSKGNIKIFSVETKEVCRVSL